MNLAASLVRLGLLFCLFLPALSFWADEASTAVSVLAPEADAQMREASVQQMHEYLQAMDRRLRTQLLAIAKGRHSDGAGKVTAEELEHLQRHFRSLERRLHSWPDDAEMLLKVRALRPLVDDLERAVERGLQSGSAELAGRGDLHRGLSVEWPASANRQLKGAPANDDCANAIPIGDGTFFGDTTTATADGEGCSSDAPDVWFAYTSPVTVRVVADTFGSGYDTVISVHHGCPGTYDNLLDCNDNVFGLQSAVSFNAQAGQTYWIRVSGSLGASGPFVLNIGPGGVIAGTVTDDATDVPLANVEITAVNAEGIFGGSVHTGSDGTYEIPGLLSADHFVYTPFVQGYLNEIYDDIPCDPIFGCEPLNGTPIPVVSGTVVDGIDIALNRGGSISGTVIDRETGVPPTGFPVFIDLWTSEGEHLDVGVHVDSSGHYSLNGLQAGSYYVLALHDVYLDELYDDVPCPGGPFLEGCELSEGALVEVEFNTTTGGIDFALDRLGAIAGSVSDAFTGLPIVSTGLEAWNENGVLVDIAFVDGTGVYQFGGLPPGIYFVKTFDFLYFDEVFDGLPCEPGCDPTTGTPVAVNVNTITSEIDFALDRLGSMTGTVTHAITDEPLSGIDVNLYNPLGQSLGFVTTGGSGSYLFDGLLPGNYTAVAANFEYVNELYDDMPCGVDCDPTSGTPIPVNLNAVTSDIDFSLEEKGAISGRVTHAMTGEPLSVSVSIYDANGVSVSGGFSSGVTGEYIVTGLNAGVYFAVAQGLGFLGELYDEMPCSFGCDPTSGTPIAVSLNAVSGDVDFTLNEKGSISGRVLHAGQPVDIALVDFYRAGDLVTSTFTDFQGRYVASDLVPGTYFVVVRHDRFNDELYDDLPCEGGCDPTTGKPIPVSANSSTEGIDFDLGYCTPTATSLCLTGKRFRVEATWENFENQMGPAFADGLTSDAGTFWFFNPGNIELVVKILDVCDRPENRFWVFGAGLTDVGVQLKVTDELTGEVVTYDNPVGTPYEPVLDTQAFATCDAGLQRRDPVSATPTPAVGALSLPAKGECLPSGNTLCLNGGRFQAEVTWQAPNGDGGAAGAVSLSDETGYFYFGGPDNVEVVVKVLDACALSSNKFWVFGAGLTNFEVTLTVIDTVSDVTRVYTNDQGNNFEAITDTSAFDTCDDL